MAGMDMGGMDMTGHRMVSTGFRMAMAPASAVERTEFALMFAMWAVMMVGMMTPSAAPVSSLRARRTEGRPRGRPFAATGWFASAISRLDGLRACGDHGAMRSSARAAVAGDGGASTQLGGALLVAAALSVDAAQGRLPGAMPVAAAVLRAPWRVPRRVAGALRLGREHGAYCLGCCWALMALLFVGGVEIADRLVLSNIRNLFGGRIIQAVSGAAPINPEILRFFDAAGVLVLEGWGMTETSTAATIATADEFKFGTIGKPFPGCEVRIADDGEILVRGPNVFQGYYKNPEATRETLADGWLHTGDIGEIDADGFVKITGRKKDIIITAGGKNITPANIEAEVRQHPLVSQCVVIGDRRPYLVALVTLDPEEAAAFAKEHGLPEDPEAVASNAQVRQEIEEHIEKLNQKFARVEQVKKFKILPRDLSQQEGELTPTLKVKRNVVADKYAGEIESLYSS